MRLFITGGTGFIGKAVCAALSQHDLLLLSRNALPEAPANQEMLQGDLSNALQWQSRVRDFGADVCLHLAWEGLPDFSYAINRKNFDSGLRFLEVLRDIRCPRVVICGSCSEYGNLKGCVTEDQSPQRLHAHAAFKSALRIVASSIFADGGSSFLWARPFYVYGPGQRLVSLVPSCMTALKSGQKPNVRTPDAVHDFVYVDDVATGLAELATGDAPPGIYNIGSGQPTSVADVVNEIANAMNLPPVYPKISTEDGFWADLTRIKQNTRWRPRYTLQEGIAHTVEAGKLT